MDLRLQGNHVDLAPPSAFGGDAKRKQRSTSYLTESNAGIESQRGSARGSLMDPSRPIAFYVIRFLENHREPLTCLLCVVADVI